MNELPSSETLNRISDAIARHPGETISGAILGTLLRSVAPELNIRAVAKVPVGPGALTIFTERYLSNILTKVGRTSADGLSGDVIYKKLNLQGTHVPPALAKPRANQWSVFVRPHDSRSLVLERDSNGIRVIVKDNPDAGDVIISRITTDELAKISEEFISPLAQSEDTRDLAATLRDATTYAVYLELLKQAGAGFYAEWNAHRRARLREQFDSRMADLDVSTHERADLLSSLDSSQNEARLERSASWPNHNIRQDSQQLMSAGAFRDEQLARDVLKATLDRMTITEIRALPIAFGHLLDIITSRQFESGTAARGQ